jgi:MFS family permease
MQKTEPADEEEGASSGPARESEHNDPYAVLRSRDFVLYLTGRLVATFGQAMFVMALGWELYERTHSAFALGMVGLTQVVPMLLFTLPAGHLADNYNRKRIILLTTVLVAMANTTMAFISAAQAPVSFVYVCLFVTGSARTFLWAATASFLPMLVERKNFSRAVTWSMTIYQFSSITGPAAAGWLVHYTHRAATVYALNALAAILCCICVGQVRKQHVVAAREKMTFKTLLTGFGFVFSNRVVLGIIALDMFAVLLGGCTAILPVYAKDILQVGPQALGLLQAALPAGSILCAFVVAHRPPFQKAGRALLLAVTIFGLATVGFGFSRWFALSFLMLLICGAADNVSVVVRHTLVQLLTPDEKRGRVSAVNNLFIGTSNELGEFESGTVAHWFGPVFAAVSGGVGTILVVLGVAWLWPEIRKYGRLDGH